MTDFDYNDKNHEIFYMSSYLEDKEDTYAKFKQKKIKWDDFLLDSCLILPLIRGKIKYMNELASRL